jgi:predicted Ser/Thr protein kinase/tetratricopeptide (TPR) repeat protein
MPKEIRQLGRYLIERVLGKGAMGVVYLARDPVIGRSLALKTLNVPAETEEADEFRQRFLREAQAAGILNHPGIVTVFDAGVDEASGLSYIAMEYVEGKSLKELVRGGHRFTYSEAARIGAALASALDYAHVRGVVHRDIKPANILITPQGVAKITDFGVARLDSSNLTASGQFIGTPNYMSPEQVMGLPVDGRSDLFSLGVVLFELLTGTRPFGGGSLTEVSYKIVHEAPAIPSQVRPTLPPAFNPILLKLLEKEPGRRYARGGDVGRALDALRRVLAGLPGEGAREAPVVATMATRVSMAAAPTATRATSVGELAGEGAPLWRRQIEPRWAVALLAAVLLPPTVVVALLAARVDRGPWASPAPGEPARRHRIVEAQWRAAAALEAANPAAAEQALAAIWDQAPYDMRARELLRQAQEMLASQARTQREEEQARRLREEGQELLRRGQARDAEARFEKALQLAPNDSLSRDYLELSRERARLSRSPRAGTSDRVATLTPPAPLTLTGEGRLELYFNSPMSDGSVELELDGKPIANKQFDFSTRGLFGWWRRKGSGVVQDSYTIPAGMHNLTVRLRDGDGRLVGEEVLPARVAGNGSYMVKIEMDSERALPRVTFTQRGS